MADRYWVGGSGTWDTANSANWAATSGGAGGVSAPTAIDDVYFDSASNATGYTVTLSGARCRSFNAVGPATGTVTFASGGLSCAGNFFLAATGVAYTSTSSVSFLGQIDADEVVITTNNLPMPGTFAFSAGMKYSLGSAFTSTNTSSTWLAFNDATTLLDTNGYTLTVATYGQSQGYVNLENSTVLINGANGQFSVATNGNFIGFPDIVFVDTGRTNTTFTLNIAFGSISSLYFNSVTLTGTGTGTTFQVTSFCVIKDLLSTKTNAFSVKFAASLGCVIRKFGISGSAGNVVTLTSTTGTATLTLREPYAVDYLNVTNINILTTGLFPFYVGANSTQSTNTNVIASVIPAVTTLYWVGGSGTWNNALATNWASSSGGAGGAGVPNPFTDVVFDSASNAIGYTVTIGTSAFCRNVSYGAPASGTLTVACNAAAFIGGNMTYASSGVATSGTQQMQFYCVSPATLTTNGVTISHAVTVVSYGGKLSLGSALTSTAGLNLNGGEFDTAGYAVTMASFSRSGFFGITWTLGASTVTLTNTTAPFSLSANGITASQPISSFILNAGTSTLTYTTSNTTTIGYTGLAWYNYNYTYTGALTVNVAYGTSYNNLTINLGTLAAGARSVAFPVSSTTMSITGTLTLNGTNEFSRVAVSGQVQNTSQSQPVIKISVANASMSYVSFLGFQNSGTTITGTSLGNDSGNTGITFSAPKTVYWVGPGGSFYSAGWATSSGGSTAAANFPLGQDSVILDNSSAALNFATATVASLDASARTTAYSVTGFVRVNTSFTGSAATTFDTFTFVGINSNCSFTQNGSPITGQFAVSNKGTVTLQANTTIGTILSIGTSGTLVTNGYSITAESGQFSGYGGFDFSGGGFIALAAATTTQFLTFTSANLRVIGTSDVRVTYAGSAARNISGTSGIATSPASSALNLKVTGGTYTLTWQGTTSILGTNLGSLDFTGFSGTFTMSNGNPALTGNLTYSSTMATGSVTQVLYFIGSSQTWTANGVTTNFPVETRSDLLSLGGAVTLGSARAFTIARGQLTLNNYTLSAPSFVITGTVAKTINFGTGNITATGTGSVFSAAPTNFSYTGTPTVNISNNSATATTVTTGAMTATQALNFNYTVGTYVLTDTSAVYRSVNLTGFGGTYANNARTYYGGFNAGSTATMTAGANVQTFAATSGTWPITRNGRTLDFPFTFNGIGGTWQLQDNFTIPNGRAFLLTNGTFDINSQTTSIGTLTLPASTSRAIANGILTCTLVDHQAGAFAVGSTYNISTTGAYGFTAGTLTINDGATLLVGTFGSSNSNVRSIAFGTGQISLSGNNTTIWTNQTATNFSFTGTFKVASTYTGSVGSRTFIQGLVSAATVQPISTTGSSGFILDTSSTDTKNLQGSWGDIDLTGVTGTFANSGPILYGNFNAGSTVTLAGGASSFNFAATSGVKTITTNGQTLDFGLAFTGIGGSWQLQDALTLGSTRGITLTAGTFDDNNKAVSIGNFSSTGSSIRSLIFGGATWSVGTSWTVSGSNFGFVGYGVINMTSSSPKTFAGGGFSWPTLNQGGSGALTISGSNRFTGLTNTVQPASIIFTAGTTNYFSSFSVSGTAGNLVTLASTSAAQAFLQKPTPWYMGANSVNGGNNTGLFFTAGAGVDYLSASYINGTQRGAGPGNFFVFF